MSVRAAPLVVDGGVFVSPSGELGIGDYALGVSQELPATEVETTAWIDFAVDGLDVTLTGVSLNLDEGSDWFFVRAGDKFGPRFGAESPYPQIVGWTDTNLTQPGNNAVTFSPALDVVNGLEDGADDFYLGVATSSWFDDRESVGRDIFGWVQLQVVDFDPTTGEPGIGLEQVDAALAFNSTGIIIGTRVALPESSTIGLALCALVALVQVVRGRRSR